MQVGESEVSDYVANIRAHTINLMLKSIEEFLHHKAIIEATRRICR
jgi:hypothetical protein